MKESLISNSNWKKITLSTFRNHEAKLASDLQVAQSLVKDLQEENKAFLSREKDFVNQLERLHDQKIAMVDQSK